MDSHASSANGGYSLVELVIVLLLLALIATIMAEGLHFGSRIWERTDRDLTSIDDAARAQHLIRMLLASASPAKKGAYVDFYGDTTGFSARITPIPAAPSRHLEEFRLSVPESARGHMDISLDTADGQQRHADLGVSGNGLTIAYLDTSGGDAEWLDRWHDRTRLPDAIRISTPDGGSLPFWPALIVRLPVTEPPHCVFDAVSSSCRQI